MKVGLIVRFIVNATLVSGAMFSALTSIDARKVVEKQYIYSYMQNNKEYTAILLESRKDGAVLSENERKIIEQGALEVKAIGGRINLVWASALVLVAFVFSAISTVLNRRLS
ncbi:hypothetical protein [Pseudomonas sp. NBRC 100443]|uniref:hypothetical protein n=1 Tax=Pseudomonas sp. NBRC 100443 TaxID=1113665 RepID=UPI0024A00631|nr:hypothetical protein [Pseudomonas sp. NBRC 100443]GLU38379.1 hypothetical protein Pssp01_24720 [Pseudomonas sp. NBRC 100443]